MQRAGNRETPLRVHVMRVLCLTATLLLCGCNSIMRKDGDSFAAGAAAPGAFEAASRDCTQTANSGEIQDLRLVGDTRYAHIRRYNALFTACMTARGYRPRPYWRNWLPQ